LTLPNDRVRATASERSFREVNPIPKVGQFFPHLGKVILKVLNQLTSCPIITYTLRHRSLDGSSADEVPTNPQDGGDQPDHEE
jgi:hypothetical protein